MKARKISFAIVALTLAFGRPSAIAQPTFTFTQLDPPGSISTEADDINSQGQIIGFFFDAAGRQHGWLFQNGSFTQIDFPGASATRTVNINNSGVITGSFLDAAGVQHGLWAQRIISRALTSPAARLRTAKALTIQERWWAHLLTPPGRYTLL